MKRMMIFFSVLGVHTVLIGGIWMISATSDMLQNKPKKTTNKTMPSTDFNNETNNQSSNQVPTLKLPPLQSGTMGDAVDLNPLGSQSTTHTVASGESLWPIAKKYGVSVKSLQSANQLNDQSKLRVGDKLIIPAK